MVDEVTEKVIEELAKQLPVKQIYQDAASPAAKEVGSIGRDIVKCMRLALAPVQYFAMVQDRYQRFLERAVNDVPENQRISPPPQILGPTLEYIRYEPEDTPIDDMFRRLLSSSMNEEAARYSHPSFPGIIKQLSSDEARLIAYMSNKSRKLTLYADYDITRNWFSDEVIETDHEGLSDQIALKEDFFVYFSHLHSLSLVEIAQESSEPVYRSEVTGGKIQIGTRRHTIFRLSKFGRMFAAACVGLPVGE